MVFVEYEAEVEEEHARVKALLDKLRIDAEVVVFWLASGHLNTYEIIINGLSSDIDWEIITNDTLKDEEWWDDLQRFRGRPENMTPGREMEHVTHVIDSTVGRTGIFNPHEEASDLQRRRSTIERNQLFGDSSIAFLRRAGVNMGIHTHHLNDEVLMESSSDEELDTDSEKSELDDDGLAYHFSSDTRRDSVTSPQHRPLLSSPLYRNSYRRSSRSFDPTPLSETGDSEMVGSASTIKASYGTMLPSRASYRSATERGHIAGTSYERIPQITENSPSPGVRETPNSSGLPTATEEFPDYSQADSESPDQSRSRSSQRGRNRTSPSAVDTSQSQPGKESATLPFNTLVQSTPNLLSVDTPSPSFAYINFNGNFNDNDASKTNRPSFSRQSSLGRFSSRPMPETKVHVEDDQLRTISFAEQPDHNPRSVAHSRHHSRQGSQRSTFGPGDANLTIPELLESYKLDARLGGQGDGGSTYSTQGIALSFNDLPSRAQHLILNELLRQNSKDTAVILTTLPIPSEGTSLDEISSIQYLSDVEILCNELPPTLMVLSNNMTVTVSL
jgi:potassium/chloride transporter 9